ncbi:MAG: hypothetical protein NC086_08120 [Alistipes sp.]|nr:hypothetical protein [Alistipes sp.]
MKETLRKFMVYMDDGKAVFKCAVPAKDENEVRNYVAGNGEVIAIKDVTEEFCISSDRVIKALSEADFSTEEVMFISRTLTHMGIAD